MGLTLDSIEKNVEGVDYLSDMTFDLESGSKNVILGRTLAGKTTMLRIMAGLDRPTAGRVLVDGRDVAGLSVRKRSVAMVYQQFINYPSFTVYNNIASPLKVGGVDKSEIEKKVVEAAKMLHLDNMMDRLPSELSGGQQQRLAIARALVKDADLLLLDEPLVNLDYKLREELLEELQQIFEKRDSIVVYTTTEPSEALKLGGHIVVIDEGRILQTGSTADVYRNPASVKVAELFSDPPINLIEGELSDGMIRLGSDITVPAGRAYPALEPGRYRFGVRPNHLYFARRTDRDVKFKSTVDISEINGSETFIHFQFNGGRMVLQEVGIDTRKPGSDIEAYVDPDNFFVYTPDGELVISPNGKGPNV